MSRWRDVWRWGTGLALVSLGWAQYDEADLLPGIDDRWSRYESPNFELYCDDSESEARNILHDLELLRAVFLGERGEHERKRIPVTVFAFRSGREFDTYAMRRDGGDKRLAGLYVPGPDRATILLRPMRDRESARQVAFHEYVHHMFRAIEEQPPLWFNEGMAELLAGIKLERGKLSIGHPVVGRAIALRDEKLLPLETLFEVGHGSKHYTSSDHTGLFYAQSWALLHYLRYGKHKLEPEAVKRFLTIVGDRRRLETTNVKSLFEDCFKMNYKRMERDLARYVRRGSYSYGRVPLPDIPDRQTYAKTRLSVAEARTRLAEVAFRTSSSAAALVALLQEGAKPGADARIYEVLGAESRMLGESEKALEYWNQAWELGSRNSAVLRELARQEWDRWFSRASHQLRLPDEVTIRMRELLVAAIRAEPGLDEAYEMLAWVEVCAETPSNSNLNAVQQHFTAMKKRDRTLLALALFRARLNHKDEAIKLLREINRFEPDDWTLDGAEVALAQLEGVSRDLISLADDSSVRRQGIQRVTQSTTRFPSIAVPADL